MADAGDHLNVVPIRECNANLRDIPGLLRQMADNIDNGEYDKVATLLVVMPRKDEYPEVFGWGDVDGENHPIVQLELAKARLARYLVKRSS